MDPDDEDNTYQKKGTDEEPLECQKCHQTFKRKQALKKHIDYKRLVSCRN